MANFFGKKCEYPINQETCNKTDSNHVFCPVWRSFGFCSFDYVYNYIPIPAFCPKSCDLCNTINFCDDNKPDCVNWAALDFCDTIVNKDPNLCKRSCGLC